VKVGNFGFFGEELFYLVNDKIIFYDLYTEKIREIPISAGKLAIVTDERIFLIDRTDHLLIYEFITIPDDK
jgi:hypothetical protein